ncbi:hypothetical protein G6F35_011197 [Rhizopus arrhizus]|nr:hypothetical protein G6F35_011197 [Rhizopus arrhizus]
MPAEITAPPAAAPTALPRLKAPTFTDDAKPGASVAARITPICSGGTTAKVATPKISSEIAAPTGERDQRAIQRAVGHAAAQAVTQREAQADLRQHRCLRGQRARGDAGLHARVGGGAHAGVRALDADVHGQALVQEAHAVLHVELARADVEVLVEQQAVRVLQVQVVQERAADVVEVARYVMVVLLEPQAGFQLVDAHRPRQRGGEAIAVDGVVGAADRDRQHPVGTRVGRLARRPPVALATVVMMVGQQLQAALLAQAQVGIHRVQVVVTQRTALIVGVVDAADIAAEFALRSIEGTGRAIRGGHGAIPVRRVDVPVIAQAAGQHVLGQVGVVGLAGTRGRHERTEAVVADIPDRLGVELARGLVLAEKPLMSPVSTRR